MDLNIRKKYELKKPKISKETLRLRLVRWFLDLVLN